MTTSNLVMKVANKYVCWNSFKSEWFLGPRLLSEVFFHNSPRISEVNKVFPQAREVWSYDQDGCYEVTGG